MNRKGIVAKELVVYLVVLVLGLLLVGCVEESFVVGFGTGVAAMKEMSDNAQGEFIEAVNELNVETARLKEGVANIDGVITVKPKVVEKIEELKGREKDPVTWIALGSILGNAIMGGRASKKGN